MDQTAAVLESLVWLMGKANHTRVEKDGRTYRRGELVTTHEKIRLALVYQENRQDVTPSKRMVRLILDLGHHSIKVTVDIYGNLAPKGNKAAVDGLDELEHAPNPHLILSCVLMSNSHVGKIRQ